MASLAVLGLAGCAGSGGTAHPLPGPAPASVPASSGAPSGPAASGAAAFAYDSLAYPVPTGTPATGLGLGDTCRAFASIVHDPRLADPASAAALRSLAARTAVTRLGAAMLGVAGQYDRRVPVVQTVKADDLCN